MTGQQPEAIAARVRELCRLPAENEWVEFKVNQSAPQRIGQGISALANSAALGGQPAGYLVWGVEDGTHAIVGTRFQPRKQKKGSEPLIPWLLQQLTPSIPFHFHEAEVDEKRVVVLQVSPARTQPVAFGGERFVRIDSQTRRLDRFPEHERALWRVFDTTPFEARIAAEGVHEARVAELLDYHAYFERLRQPAPGNRRSALEALARDGLVLPGVSGGWDVTNLGAVLLARRLADFPELGRKAVRLIRYHGSGRTGEAREWEFEDGYARCLDRLNQQVDGQLPSREVIGRVRREIEWAFPPAAVRELVANALIHQDLAVRGAGPMVEIFDGRIEITNPGEPLVETDRLVDAPPRSRNDRLASLMRRFGYSEERGMGIDRVVEEIETHELPPPRFHKPRGFTRVTLHARKKLGELGADDRNWACYLHACLRYLNGEALTNTSLRRRFGIAERNRAMASRLIRNAVESGAITPESAAAPRKAMRYIPWWAARDNGNGDPSS